MMWTAWHTAYLHRVDRMPSLKELLKRPEKNERKADDPDEHRQMSMNLMNALMNMRPKKRGKPPASNTEEPAKAAG